MRRLRLLIAALLLVGSAVFAAPPGGATGFCSEDEGCTPCGGPHVVVDGKNTRVEWIVC